MNIILPDNFIALGKTNTMRSLFFLSMLSFFFSFSQYEYEPNEEYPFGRPNPEAPKQVRDFHPMIGESKCISINRKQDGSWNEKVDMVWRFKYIMNGMGVQDETLKTDGVYAGSIRQFNADSSKWYVHYYSSNFAAQQLPFWEGNLGNDKIVLYREQKAPNGMDGFYRLTFYDMNDSGYKWIGEWVDTHEKIVYPTWKIECTKTTK